MFLHSHLGKIVMVFLMCAPKPGWHMLFSSLSLIHRMDQGAYVIAKTHSMLGVAIRTKKMAFYGVLLIMDHPGSVTIMTSWHGNIFCITETRMLPFWQNFHYWLHWKLSFWQFSVQKISSKWRNFHFNDFCPFVMGINWSWMDSPDKGPVMQSFDVSSVVRLKKLLNKQPRCQSFKIP